MSDKLKPCPFCGGEVKLVTDFSQNKDHVYCFECTECGALVYMDDLIDKDKSIEAWNTRHNPWYTGTPTEEGWYLFKFKDKTGLCWYKFEYLTIDRINKLAEWNRFDNCKWKKIEETD